MDEKNSLEAGINKLSHVSLPSSLEPLAIIFQFHGTKSKRGRPPIPKGSRKCNKCGTGDTPEWRRGPDGPHSVCNACGLHFAKLRKKELVEANWLHENSSAFAVSEGCEVNATPNSLAPHDTLGLSDFSIQTLMLLERSQPLQSGNFQDWNGLLVNKSFIGNQML